MNPPTGVPSVELMIPEPRKTLGTLTVIHRAVIEHDYQAEVIQSARHMRAADRLADHMHALKTRTKHPRSTTLLITTLLGGLACTGCGDALDDEELASVAEEEFDELEEAFAQEDLDEDIDEEPPTSDADGFASLPDTPLALGELSCATSSNTDVVYQYDCDLLGGESCYYLTPNTDYHNDYSSGEVCQPYQTLKTQTTGMSSSVGLTHWAVWAGAAPNTQSACERSHVELAAYKFNQSGGGWSLVGTVDNQGVWSGSSCSFGWALLPTTATCNSLGQCQTVHAVTARAYTGNYFWFPTPNRVYLGTFRS